MAKPWISMHTAARSLRGGDLAREEQRHHGVGDLFFGKGLTRSIRETNEFTS